MVKGLTRFRDHFSSYQDHYVLIGGTASHLAMREEGYDFRVTKDLDIVLCLEALNVEFAENLWGFIKSGKYQHRQKSTGQTNFYRFTEPGEDDYPFMLELFSRVPDVIQLKEQTPTLTPIPIDEEVSSLSAILLDDDYYSFIHQSKRIIDGLTTIGAECIIPLKAKAYLDLSERKSKGESIDSKNITKHKNDIFRLFTILAPSNNLILPASIKDDLANCLTKLSKETIDLKALGISKATREDVIGQLSQIYNLTQG
jgi:hypothetical protein